MICNSLFVHLSDYQVALGHLVFTLFSHATFDPGICTDQVYDPPPPWLVINEQDIDDKSIQFALDNVQRNNLQSRIKILPTLKDGPLLPLDLFQIEKYQTSATWLMKTGFLHV